MQTHLAELAELAADAGADSLAGEAQSLLERVREGRFFVACLGQFKRGKSTLINALLGEEVLPSGVAPVTSVVTIVRWGERRARVRIGEAEWLDVAVEALGAYVSETRNPENRLGVRGVEVFCPSPFLERGLCLVDTPGISSVFVGNTAETQAFIPHIDAAILVLGGDPPISGEELTLTREVTARVRDVLYVLNKADRLSDAERREAVEFTRGILRDQLALTEPIVYQVSALERLRRVGAERDGRDERDWGAFVRQLDALAQAGGGELVAQAASRGFRSLCERLEGHLREARDALVRPVEESERRLEGLRRCARDAEQAASELSFLFDAEQKKLGRVFDDKRSQFVAETFPEIARQLDTRLSNYPKRRGPGVRAFAVSQAQDVTEPVVRAWMERERPLVEHQFAGVTERFVDHANAFLERLRTSGQLPADVVPARLTPESGLRARSRYHFASFMRLTTPPLWLWMVDWFRSEDGTRRAARGAGLAFAQRLLDANANRVTGDFAERITESRRSVEGALRRRLQEVVDAAEAGARRASELRRAGADAVASELVAIDRRLAALVALRVEGGRDV